MGDASNAGWWSELVGYQVYVRSFCDSNGDGIGDLPGITSKLEHLQWLGVGLVWLTPFYVSPQADFGYDVADYCGVEPAYGTLDDFDALIAEAHRLGLRVVGDLVPNHTSDQHPWFRAALEDPASPERSYYHWRDPGPDGGPPNNWISHFGGPAWTLEPTSGQYYLHLFLPEQPDLNWANPAVVEEFDAIMRFWLDRDIDGFRIDVAHALTKHADMPDIPQLRPVTPEMSPRQVFSAFDHRYDLNQPGTKDIYRRWRAIAADYDALLLGEVYLRTGDPNDVARYVTGRDGLHRAFYFAPMHTPWETDALWEMFQEAIAAAPEDLSWPLSSHDDSRAPSRFGGGDLGRARALGFATLLVSLPGLAFLYQGDELGLVDVEVPADQREDPVGTRNVNPGDSRDRVRTPMPWAPGPGGGFTTPDATPWLPIGDRRAGDTVGVQRADERSWLSRHRALLSARAAITVGDAPLEWLTERGDPVIAFRRGELVCALNTGQGEAAFTIPAGAWEMGFGVSGRHQGAVSGTIILDAPDAVLLRSAS